MAFFEQWWKIGLFKSLEKMCEMVFVFSNKHLNQGFKDIVGFLCPSGHSSAEKRLLTQNASANYSRSPKIAYFDNMLVFFLFVWVLEGLG